MMMIISKVWSIGMCVCAWWWNVESIHSFINATHHHITKLSITIKDNIIFSFILLLLYSLPPHLTFFFHRHLQHLTFFLFIVAIYYDRTIIKTTHYLWLSLTLYIYNIMFITKVDFLLERKKISVFLITLSSFNFF